MQTFYGGSGVYTTRANVIVLMTDGAPNGFTADWSTQVKSTSHCGAPLVGYIARNTPNEEGIFSVAPAASAAMAATPVIAANGRCAFNSNVSNWNTDFTSVPVTDPWGDALTGTGTYVSTASTQVTDVTDTNLTGQEQQFLDLSKNAADSAATRIRTDTYLRVTIDTIALAGNPGTVYDSLDATLLNRMANTPSSTIYSPAQPVGAYFYAQDASYLGAEFAAVAADISARLSK
jgi:hypothetical protein